MLLNFLYKTLNLRDDVMILDSLRSKDSRRVGRLVSKARKLIQDVTERTTQSRSLANEVVGAAVKLAQNEEDDEMQCEHLT